MQYATYQQPLALAQGSRRALMGLSCGRQDLACAGAQPVRQLVKMLCNARMRTV